MVMQFRFYLLAGLTGSGKTDLLRQLAAAGEQVLDLEALSHHRGSAFGGLNQPPQPTQAVFESRLEKALAAFDPTRPVFLEQKGRTVGKLVLPDWLLIALEPATILYLDVSPEIRLSRAMQTYRAETDDQLAEALGSLQPRLPALTFEAAQEALRRGDRRSFFRTMVAYYDGARGYLNQLAARPFAVTIPADDPENAWLTVLRLVEEGKR